MVIHLIRSCQKGDTKRGEKSVFKTRLTELRRVNHLFDDFRLNTPYIVNSFQMETTIHRMLLGVYFMRIVVL